MSQEAEMCRTIRNLRIGTRYLVLLSGAFIGGACMGGSISPSEEVARAIVTANAMLSTAYGSELRSCVDVANSESDADVCISNVEMKWAPVRSALSKVQGASDLVQAYCVVYRAAPANVGIPRLSDQVCK